MVGQGQGKQRRNFSNHSEDLRKTALHNAFWKRQKERLKDSISEPWDVSQISNALPPLRPTTGDPASAKSRAESVLYSRVLSMRNLRRRTTASLNFPLHSLRQPSRSRQHLCSPTRRNNPQPDGLVYQSPYNRHNKAYEIWIPNQHVIERRLPGMMHHLGQVNFSCKHPQQLVSVQRSAPAVDPGMQSNYQTTFQKPELKSYSQPHIRPTRFGNRPSTLTATGIVPNSVANGSDHKATSTGLLQKQGQ